MEDVYNVDLFLMQLTYLPFKDVINRCQINTKYHNYCTSETYNNNWKAIIDNTFGSIYGYENKLDKIWKDLKYNQNKYEYIVYTNLIKYLDPLTQLMIYYKQKDMDSFNDKYKYTNEQRFLALFLLQDKQLVKYLPSPLSIYQGFTDILNGNIPDKKILSKMLILMAKNGNVKGIKYLAKLGANIHCNDDDAFKDAATNGHLDVVRFLIEEGVDIHIQNDFALRFSARNGHLDVVQYLIQNGANIHAQIEHALILASERGHLEVVKYLVEHGANIHAKNNSALEWAVRNEHVDVAEYLIEHGADIGVLNNI